MDETGSQDRASARRLSPAVFFDRDGVLNIDSGYPCKPSDIVWVEGAKPAVAALKRLGFLVFVVTNQAGVARGYYEEADVHALHDWMQLEFAAVGGRIDAYYFCPHHPEHGLGDYRRRCDCRKPAPGMIQQAMREWPVRLEGSFLIGDRETDLAAAQAAGLPGYKFAGGDLLAFVKARLPSPPQ